MRLSARARTNHQQDAVSLRTFPYPYRAALTLCSDIDGTHTAEHFLTIQDFLCSTQMTPMGPGLGLEIGNSFYPFTPDDSFAYRSSRPRDRKVIETLIRAGYIDCIHAFGEGNTVLADALRVLDDLERAGCTPDVWTDHYRTPYNLGKDTTYGTGDDPASPHYHLNRTRAFGIKFVWRGRGSSLPSQGIPLRPGAFAATYDSHHPTATLKAAGKETAKIALAYAGSRRFALHRGNALYQVVQLQDRQRFFEFQRSNPHWGGLSTGHDSVGLAYVLRREYLQHLVRQGGTSIIYTHLGLGSEPPGYLPQATRNALHDLAAAYHDGDIYITTTSRLLNYSVYRDYLQWHVTITSEGTHTIVIDGVHDPVSGWQQPSSQALQGITFYVPDSSRAEIVLGSRHVPVIDRHPADHTGRESVALPRVPLVYPQMQTGK